MLGMDEGDKTEWDLNQQAINNLQIFDTVIFGGYLEELRHALLN